MCMCIFNSIVGFFESETWAPIGNFFTFIGIISAVFTIVRFFHNCKQKEWSDNVEINDYDSDYDTECNEKSPIYSKVWDEQSPYASVIVFKPTNCIIPKLKTIELDPESGKSLKTIEIFKNVSPETPICIKIERAECIPQYRLRWYSDYGEYYDYDLTENRRNGINNIVGVIYKKNIFTTIRKIFEWK